MLFRPGDEPFEYWEEKHWKRDPDINREIDRRVGAWKSQWAPEELNEDDEDESAHEERIKFPRGERIYIDLRYHQEIGRPLDENVYVAELNRVRRRINTPQITRPTEDFVAAWSQPEASDLWGEWCPEIDSVAPEAIEGSKTVFSFWGGGRVTTHLKYAHDSVIHNATVLRHFDGLSRSTPPGREASLGQPVMTIREYSASSRHMQAIAEALIEVAPKALARIGRAGAMLAPNEPLFKWGAGDGNLVRAWTRQKSSKRGGVVVPEIEARYRRRTPRAGFRVYGYTSEGQETKDSANAGGRTLKIRTSVRGYLETVVSDVVSPFALGMDLEDAARRFEPDAIRRILPPLYEEWPDCPLSALVVDKLWDVEEFYEWLLLNYGIHLVAIRKPSNAIHGGRQLSVAQRESVMAFSGEGIALCRQHGEPMFYEGLEPATREAMRQGLKPGEPVHPGLFSTRLRCEAEHNPCGRVRLPTRLRYGAFPFYPHHPLGRPQLYAFRVALQHQRNVAESLFSSQEIAYKLGTDGADRTRVYSFEVTEALYLLSLITRGLLTLAALRQHLKIPVGQPGAGIGYAA